MKYPVVFEPTRTGFSAYVLDMDGCVAIGATLEEIRENIRGAVTKHVAGMREDGDAIPEPSIVEFVQPYAGWRNIHRTRRWRNQRSDSMEHPRLKSIASCGS